MNDKFIKEWESILIAQNTLNINGISNVLRNKSKSAGKFKWKYKNNGL